MKPTKIQIITAMRQYGGGFINALAIAWNHADPDNKRKIEETWTEYFAKYEAMAAAEIQNQEATATP